MVSPALEQILSQSPDTRLIASIRTIHDPRTLLELVLEYPEWLTDGYYRDIGVAIRETARKILV